MASKKIEFILDVDSKPIDVAVDATLNLKQQYRELVKELNKTQAGTKEFELLSAKLGEVKDNMEVTTAKSRDLFGSLSLLPGPVGAFAGTVDSAIGSLKLFTSFSFKDLKFQLGETLNDFKDIAGNLGKATGITKVYTVLNNALAKSFVAVGAGEAAAAAGARAFAAALTATGIGALVVLLGLAASALYDMATGEDEAKAATDRLNASLESQNQLLDANQNAAKRRNAEYLATLKAVGKSEKEIRDAQIRLAYDDYQRAYDAEQQARKLYNDNLGKADAEGLKKLGDNLDKRTEATKQAYSDYIVTGRNAQATELSEQKAANQKIVDANKQRREKIAADNKSADELLLDLQQENAVLALKNERDRQDQELKNQKKDEENKINALLISQEKKNMLLAQVTTKFNAKQADLNKKRQDDDLKEQAEYLVKLEDIRIKAITNQQEREKAELQKGYNDTKTDLDKALEDKKISQEQYNTAILNLNAALAAGIKKIDDDKNKQDQDDRLKKLDDELKFLQIKGEALMQGTKAFYENQRAILKASEERELADTTLTEEQKTLIKEKYVQARKKLAEQEFAANAQVVSQTLDAVAKLSGAIASSYDEEAKTSKDAFEKRKKLQVATALMSAASGVIQILTQPSTLPSPFDWIVKGINAAALAVTTGVQISNIKKTQFGGGGDSGTGGGQNLGRNYEEGGLIGGKRHAQGGTMIEAEAGEAIMTRGAVTMFAPMLSMMNQMGGGTSFGNQLFIRPDAAAVEKPQQAQEPIIMKTYVVSSELTTESEKQARLKDLSTL
jgi:hypothetical protein